MEACETEKMCRPGNLSALHHMSYFLFLFYAEKEKKLPLDKGKKGKIKSLNLKKKQTKKTVLQFQRASLNILIRTL